MHFSEKGNYIYSYYDKTENSSINLDNEFNINNLILFTNNCEYEKAIQLINSSEKRLPNNFKLINTAFLFYERLGDFKKCYEYSKNLLN